MSKLTLVIGNKNYSSWSLRAWFLLRQAGIDFDEVKVLLHQNNSAIEQHSPSGRVPVLIDGDLKIWESLAICEYVAERYPAARLWPEDVKARAFARSISSEMHAGFTGVRKHMPMNCHARFPERQMPPGVAEDIRRITSIWNECRKNYAGAGEFLFGHFTAADAMFAPVVIRFLIYGIQLDPVSSDYRDMILSLPAMQEWLQAACDETETIPELEALK